MKLRLLDFIVCPDCQADLELYIREKNKDEIITGYLKCLNCGEKYTITNGIPHFITNLHPLSKKGNRTVKAFGWEWQKFSRYDLDILDINKQLFLDWLHPAKPKFFKDKVILDAGCGSGRFSIVASGFGAKEVLAVDASNSVETAYDNAKYYKNVHIIKADISCLPFRKKEHSQIDFIFSIGVLHHMDDPEAGFASLVNHLKKNCTIHIWVYGRENNGWLVKLINPLRVMFTSRMPYSVLYALSFLIAFTINMFYKAFYKPVNESNFLSRLHSRLPCNEYMSWLAKLDIKYIHLIVFDHLVAPVTFYLRNDEIKKWIDSNSMQLVSMSWRNNNSWRSCSRKTCF